jgi:hypothetical protein
MADDTDIQSAGSSPWSAFDQAARVAHEAPDTFAAALRDMLTPAISVTERSQNEYA